MGIPWDRTGINCYGMGMGQINMSHGQPCRFGSQESEKMIIGSLKSEKIESLESEKSGPYRSIPGT